MRERHPCFDQEIPPDAVLWRYMDFPKFVSMVQERALYFSRSDLLGDPLEGSLTQAVEVARQARLANPPVGRTPEELQRILEHSQRFMRHGRLMVYVNCWHRGDHESMALWKGYGGGPYAVAVRTTFGRLDSLLPEKFRGSTGGSSPARLDDPVPEMPIYLGPVRYIDHRSTTLRMEHEDNLFGPLAYKSIAYASENEVRAIQWNIPGYDSSGELPLPSGFQVPIDLQQLVSDIVVSPLAPEWFTPVVRATFERCGFDFTISGSVTSTPPVH